MHHASHLADVLILLSTAVVLVPIISRLKMSPILAYLIGGLIVGPTGLAFVTDIAGTRILAEFGVVFLLFSIGLELSLRRLTVMRRYVFGLGLLQVLVTSVAIGGLAYALLGDVAAALVIGGGLALSSTAMVSQLLVEHGELASRPGRISFAILIFQDLAVVPLLALIPLLAAQEGSVFGALSLAMIKAVAAILGIMIAGRILLRPLFGTVVREAPPEILTAGTLLVVLGIAYATEQADLSLALGAFLAGLLLAETEFRHQVEADIEPFRRLLLGLFFMTVGMTVDLALLALRWPEILVLTIGLLLLKTAVIIALCRIMGQTLSVAVQAGFTLSQGGEFAFVIFGIAAASALLPNDVSQLLLAVITLTMLATPFLTAAGTKLAKRIDGKKDQISASPEIADDTLRGHVVICGFGRVGQTVARLLAEDNVPFVALDLAPKRIKAARAAGIAAFYGDCTRRDMLRAVGAHDARAAVITLDNFAAADRTLDTLQREFPRLPVYVRAQDYYHSAALKAAGAREAVPEILESSLQLGAVVLRGLERPSAEVERTITRFRADAETLLARVIPIKGWERDDPPDHAEGAAD